MSKLKIGWVGMGRMGYPMAERLVKAGYDVHIWNRTRSKAEPLAAKGATLVDSPRDLAGVDVLATMVSTGKDVEQVYFGENGVLSGNKTPGIFLDCSSIAVDQSAALRKRLAERGAELVASPVSGNGKCVKAGKLSAVVSGPRGAFDKVEPIIATIAGNGVSYVGEGELARFCKIAHNVFLGVVTQNLAEITVLAEKAGVPRHAFLDFMNNSVMGSIFTRYKTNAFVNLDWTTTFTPELLRKDLDLGLSSARALGVPMPVTAATREALQSHFGAATLKDDPEAYLQMDFAALLETVALSAGLKLVSENSPYPTGLEVPQAAE
jgi:3-hydroxyisobutyrate dehydrogenase